MPLPYLRSTHYDMNKIINGKEIASNILTTLTGEVTQLKQKGIVPTLAVIQIGDNPASLAYIKQKQKAAETIGAKILMSNTLSDVSRFNNDSSVHGVIIQRPVPVSIDTYQVSREKDVDGFEENSPFDVPVALATCEILKQIHADLSKNIVIIGRGETAGKPIFEYFQKLHCTTSQIFSTTQNSNEILKYADIIISCVGKQNIVTHDFLKPGVILISVGIWRDEAGKLHGDYEESDIADIASSYTPTPGGVGPINVACLMQNLVKASMISLERKSL